MRKLGQLAFQRRVKKEATRSHDQVATEGDQENLIVLVSPAAQDALDAQPHEQQVRHGIDDLCRVRGGIVVLAHISLVRTFQRRAGLKTYLLAPVQGGSDRAPEASLCRRIRNRGQRPPHRSGFVGERRGKRGRSRLGLVPKHDVGCRRQLNSRSLIG